MTRAVATNGADPLEAALRTVSKRYFYPCQRLLGFVRDRGLNLGDPRGWDAYLESLADMTASTYNLHLAAFKAAIRALAATSPDPEIRRRIELEVSAVKGKKKANLGNYIQGRVLTPEEVVRLIAACNAPRWGERHDSPRPDIALVVELLYKTGLRISEALGIKLDHMRPFGEFYRVRILGKGDLEAFINVPRELVDRVRSHFAGKTFLFEHHGRRYAREYISMAIHRVGMATFRRAISAHSLRHSIGTEMYRKTGRIDAVSAFLRHRSINTTLQYYVHGPFSDAEVSALTALPIGAEQPATLSAVM